MTTCDIYRTGTTEVTGIKCLKCGSIIFSRTTHDYRRCKCGAVAIDGGFDYMKVAGEYGDYVPKKLFVDATRRELYDDWNNMVDKWGRIDQDAPQ